MSETHLITRAEIARAMARDYNAMLYETFVHNWKRCDTIVADQGNNLVENDAIDFHLLEFYLSGGHRYEGCAEMEHGDTASVDLVPGCIGYYQPRSEVYQESTGSARLHHIYIDDVIFRETAQSVLKGDPDQIRMLGFHGVFDPNISALAGQLLDEARSPTVGSDLRADLISQEIALLMLRRRVATRVKLPTPLALSNKQLAQVISYLEDQIEDIGGMDTLAALIDMDVFRFTRAFKETTGTSPHQFVIQRRLERVKELLCNTNDSLAEISYATGFANQAHMTSTFSKCMGISPGKWRKQAW